MEHPLVQAARQCRINGSVVAMSLTIHQGRILIPNGRFSHTYCRRDGELSAELVFTGDGENHLLEVYHRIGKPSDSFAVFEPSELMARQEVPAHLCYWLNQFVLGERCSAMFCGRYDDPHHASLISGVYDFALG